MTRRVAVAGEAFGAPDEKRGRGRGAVNRAGGARFAVRLPTCAHTMYCSATLTHQTDPHGSRWNESPHLYPRESRRFVVSEHSFSLVVGFWTVIHYLSSLTNKAAPCETRPEFFSCSFRHPLNSIYICSSLSARSGILNVSSTRVFVCRVVFRFLTPPSLACFSAHSCLCTTRDNQHTHAHTHSTLVWANDGRAHLDGVAAVRLRRDSDVVGAKLVRHRSRGAVLIERFALESQGSGGRREKTLVDELAETPSEPLPPIRKTCLCAARPLNRPHRSKPDELLRKQIT